MCSTVEVKKKESEVGMQELPTGGCGILVNEQRVLGSVEPAAERGLGTGGTHILFHKPAL